jgi:hypothetical protein
LSKYRRFLTSLLITSCVSVSVVDAAGVKAGGDSSTTSTSAVSVISPAVQTSVHVATVSTMHPELVTQLRSKKGGSIRFWEAVSWCETNHNWNNGGYFAGGLGMAQSVWINYGGKQFASRSSRATKQEQIIVANRVAFFGFQTKNVFRTLDDKANNKPFFRPAVGWRSMKNWGRGCINWETRKPLRERYTEAGLAEWLKTRPGYVAKKSVSSSSVSKSSVSSTVNYSSDKTKRCPKWEAQLRANGLIPVDRFSYIMWRESRCTEKIVSKPNSNGSRDYGLMQINSSWKTVTAQVCGSKFGDLKVLLNSKCNLKVARYLFNNGGINHWASNSGKG